MVLTRDFKDTIKERVARDPSFREELFKEGIECLLTGDVDTGKAVLRDYINKDSLSVSLFHIPLPYFWPSPQTSSQYAYEHRISILHSLFGKFLLLLLRQV